MIILVVAGTVYAARVAIKESGVSGRECVIVTPSTHQSKLRGLHGCTALKGHGSERVSVEAWSLILRACEPPVTVQ